MKINNELSSKDPSSLNRIEKIVALLFGFARSSELLMPTLMVVLLMLNIRVLTF
jgi:hypothetical protein